MIQKVKDFYEKYHVTIKSVGFVGYMIVEHFLGKTEVGSVLGLVFNLLGA